MSDKMTCPACNARLSSVLRAFTEGEPCPECGLPAEAAWQLEAARKRGADNELLRRLAEAEREAAAAKAEAERYRTRLEQIQRVIKGEYDE